MELSLGLNPCLEREEICLEMEEHWPGVAHHGGSLAFLQAVAPGALAPDRQQHLTTLGRAPSLRPHPGPLNQPDQVFEHLRFNLPGGRAVLGPPAS